MATDTEIVLKYMVDGNRPYSIVNLVDAFAASGIKKATLTRILDALVETSKLTLVVRLEAGEEMVYAFFMFQNFDCERVYKSRLLLRRKTISKKSTWLCRQEVAQILRHVLIRNNIK